MADFLPEVILTTVNYFRDRAQKEGKVFLFFSFLLLLSLMKKLLKNQFKENFLIFR